MKKIWLAFIFIFITAWSYSQSLTKEEYLQKSKRQRTTGWVLLGTGVAAIITGALIDNSNKGEEQTYSGGFIEVGGIVCSLVSIPFFIKASKNKKRAAAITFNYPVSRDRLFHASATKQRPAVALKITL